MMGTVMPETGGIKMEAIGKTTSFCVVCTNGIHVYFQAYWETTPDKRIKRIADIVSTAVERFGHCAFSVVVTEISD